jgi:hypothetical protein
MNLIWISLYAIAASKSNFQKNDHRSNKFVIARTDLCQNATPIASGLGLMMASARCNFIMIIEIAWRVCRKSTHVIEGVNDWPIGKLGSDQLSWLMIGRK